MSIWITSTRFKFVLYAQVGKVLKYCSKVKVLLLYNISAQVEVKVVGGIQKYLLK